MKRDLFLDKPSLFRNIIILTTSNFGKLDEFNSNVEDWQSYVERVELYFIDNGIDDETKTPAYLLSSCSIRIVQHAVYLHIKTQVPLLLSAK